jgi:hypothetical protein
MPSGFVREFTVSPPTETIDGGVSAAAAAGTIASPAIRSAATDTTEVTVRRRGRGMGMIRFTSS